MSTHHHRNGAPRVSIGADPLAVFQARCETWTYLLLVAGVTFAEAASGLQDAAQQLAEDDEPTFRQACREADAKHTPKQHAAGGMFSVPNSTLWAAQYLIKQNDPARLRKWLDEHSERERTAIWQTINNKQVSDDDPT